jgi:hypothetical protein
MNETKEPIKPHPSHQWAEDKPQTRCERCGAYKHLSSGFAPCRNPEVVLVSVAPGGSIPTARAAAFEAISRERDYQDAKWGMTQDRPREVGAWILLMEQFLADAREAWCNQRGDHAALDELRKVLACGVASLEQHGVVPRI